MGTRAARLYLTRAGTRTIMEHYISVDDQQCIWRTSSWYVYYLWLLGLVDSFQWDDLMSLECGSCFIYMCNAKTNDTASSEYGHIYIIKSLAYKLRHQIDFAIHQNSKQKLGSRFLFVYVYSLVSIILWFSIVYHSNNNHLIDRQYNVWRMNVSSAASKRRWMNHTQLEAKAHDL